MGNIGSGSGSSYPGTLDTQTAVEVDSPAGGKTKARAAVPNDLAACVIAIETELGTNPKGSKGDVKTFLQTQHNADGTHKGITTDTLSATGQITSTIATGTAPIVLASTTPIVGLNLPMTGEASATNATAASVNLGNVTTGDRIWVSGSSSMSVPASTASTVVIQVAKSAGTATIVFGNTHTLLTGFVNGNTSFVSAGHISVGDVCQVTGSGSLTLTATASKDAASTITDAQIYAYFIKKQ